MWLIDEVFGLAFILLWDEAKHFTESVFHQVQLNVCSLVLLCEWKEIQVCVIVCCDHQMSRLVASEVIRGGTLATRVAIIEKWVAVADICRCLHNYNGVLQVCAAFQNSSVFRLKKTWEKVSKTVSDCVQSDRWLYECVLDGMWFIVCPNIM